MVLISLVKISIFVAEQEVGIYHHKIREREEEAVGSLCLH